MYVMGYRFQMHALRNAIVDVLYDYYSQPALEPPAAAINMEDVKFIFDQTPNDSPMRRYLVCQLLFYFFDGKRAGKPLPKEWATVLGEANDISLVTSGWRLLDPLPFPGLEPAPVNKVSMTFTPDSFSATVELTYPDVPLSYRIAGTEQSEEA